MRIFLNFGNLDLCEPCILVRIFCKFLKLDLCERFTTVWFCLYIVFGILLMFGISGIFGVFIFLFEFCVSFVVGICVLLLLMFRLLLLPGLKNIVAEYQQQQ